VIQCASANAPACNGACASPMTCRHVGNRCACH
jgi:hypothetical protein